VIVVLMKGRPVQRGSDANASRCGFDADEIQVEKRVNVGSQEQAVRWGGCATVRDGYDVRRFERFDGVAAGDRAPGVVGFNQRVAELALAPPLENRPHHATLLLDWACWLVTTDGWLVRDADVGPQGADVRNDVRLVGRQALNWRCNSRSTERSRHPSPLSAFL
jgi:hypothetical protein